MRRLANQTIENTELVITPGEHTLMGPRLLVRNCRVVLEARPRSLCIAEASFEGCTIDVKALKNFRWCSASLKDCIFRGRLIGNDFGHWPRSHGPHGRIESCDFVGAFPDGVRFFGCDMGTIKLPTWPFFTILHIAKKAERAKKISWPGRMGLWAVGDLGVFIHSVEAVGITQWAPSFLKAYGGTEEELKACLTELGDVWM